MNLDLHATGASFIAHQKEHNPRTLIIELVEQNPHGDRKELFSRFRDLIRDDDDYQRAVDWYFFVNMHDYLVSTRNSKNRRERADPVETQRDVDKLKQRVVEVVLLNITLPSGRLLRDATFAECAQAGGWFNAVAKLGKRDQIVGKTVTEAQLQKLRKRWPILK